MPSRIAIDAYRFRTGMLLCVGVVLGCGCRGDTTPATYSVRGKILYKSTQRPLTQGSVLFQSLSEPRVQASGDIQSDGSFDLASDVGKPGTVAGEHQVMIQPPVLEAGQKPIVHKRFTSYSTSGLKATVQAKSTNELVLEVD